MIFWIFVILTVLGIAVCIATGKINDKHDYRNKNNTKFVNFVYYNDKPIYWTFGITAVISGIIALIMLIIIIVVQTSTNGYMASSEQRYNALVYKAQAEEIRDEFGIVNKEYIDEVQAWNEDLAKYQSYSHNFWIGIFYPKRQYDGFEFIDLESIKVKE